MTNFIKHGALQLSLPDNWFDASQLVAVGPEEEGFRPNIVVSIEPLAAGETVEQFSARTLAGVRRSEGFTLGGERAATFGPHKGMLREYTFTVQGQRVAQLQFNTLRDQTGYTFTYTQRPDKMNATRGMAEQFFATAQVEGKAPSAPASAPAPAAKNDKGLGSLW